MFFYVLGVLQFFLTMVLSIPSLETSLGLDKTRPCPKGTTRQNSTCKVLAGHECDLIATPNCLPCVNYAKCVRKPGIGGGSDHKGICRCVGDTVETIDIGRSICEKPINLDPGPVPRPVHNPYESEEVDVILLDFDHKAVVTHSPPALKPDLRRATSAPGFHAYPRTTPAPGFLPYLRRATSTPDFNLGRSVVEGGVRRPLIPYQSKRLPPSPSTAGVGHVHVNEMHEYLLEMATHRALELGEPCFIEDNAKFRLIAQRYSDANKFHVNMSSDATAAEKQFQELASLLSRGSNFCNIQKHLECSAHSGTCECLQGLFQNDNQECRISEGEPCTADPIQLEVRDLAIDFLIPLPKCDVGLACIFNISMGSRLCSPGHRRNLEPRQNSKNAGEATDIVIRIHINSLITFLFFVYMLSIHFLPMFFEFRCGYLVV